MAKIIIFVLIIVIILFTLKQVYDLITIEDDEDIEKLVTELRLKILQAKSRLKQGIEGAKEDIERYEKELEELEELNK